jgi:hypothetical protein
MRVSSLAVLCGLVLICLALPANKLAAKDAAFGAPTISLAPLDDGRWRVTYRLARPAAALRFERVPDDWRAGRWAPVDFAFRIAHADRSAAIARTDGKPFRKVAFDVEARYLPLPKDYAPFSPFTDGGLLIHTGQFHACADDADCDGAQWRIDLKPPKGAHVVVNGAVVKTHARFVSSHSGMNVHVGRAAPLETSHFIAVIDEALPVVVRETLYALLPNLMDYFSERLGALPRKPMLFASLDPYPPSGSGFNSQGGVLPDQIFIHLYGERWAEAAAAHLDGFLPWFFAHEAAHLFQTAGLDAPYNTDQSWIHEGGADAFAALTIVELGGVAPAHIEGRIDAALRKCAAGLAALDGRPLNASAAAGAFGNYYDCGLLIHLAIDAEVRRASAGERDLMTVWASFLTQVRAGAPWDQKTFLRVAREAGAPNAVVAALALAEEPQRDPEDFLRRMMAQAGVATFASAP